jgi:hypothetical protein
MAWSMISGWTYSGGNTFCITSTPSLATLFYTGTPSLFSKDKNYQIVSKVSGLNTATGSSFSIGSGWKGDNVNYLDSYFTTTVLPALSFLQVFSRPTEDLVVTDYIIYTASGAFGSYSSPAAYLSENWIYEIEFDISGYSVERDTNRNGWIYLSNSYKWYQNSTYLDPIGVYDNLSDSSYNIDNYLGKKINLEEFNLSFSYSTTDNMTMSLYVGDDYPDVSGYGNKVAEFYSDGNYAFYGLVGNCFYFVGSASNSPTEVSGALSDIYVEGGYYSDNNDIFHFGGYDDYQIVDFPTMATTSTYVVSDDTVHINDVEGVFGPTGSNFEFYTTQLGTVSNLSQLESKLGNGEFVAGVWENGVWNNGWRVDENIYDFDDVVYSIPISKDIKWRIQISGPTQSVSNFSVGDRISIGNIIAININEERKLLRDLFTITYVDTTNIIVELYSSFPFRRIEKDSTNHKIRITKNVWLNGAFLNGYFEGLWSNGLFKGFPYITEMYNTTWVDGTFDGGHFHSRFPRGTFSNTFISYLGDAYDGKLGLTFSYYPHGLLPGDIININKDSKNINSSYDGDVSVLLVGDYWAIVDKKYGSYGGVSESGSFRRITSNGLIQNFKFFDNNVSLSPTSSVLDYKFLYNSWIDVNYSTQSSTTLNKNQLLYAESKGGEYSDVNLYGYITEDILSSKSTFRDGYSSTSRFYSLGTKYTIYQDFLGDISEFSEPFGTDESTYGGLANFYNNGWEYALGSTSSVATFSRTPDEELKIEFGKPSTIPPGAPSVNTLILNNSNIEIERKRYSLVEFDLISHNNLTEISFINYVDSANVLLPTNVNVNHFQTSNVKKYEYFFNRGKLSLLTKTTNPGWASVTLDNIKFYEVDMVPFFQYTTTDYVNPSVQIPYFGVAPVIDYSNSNFSFIDNVSIGLELGIQVTTVNAGGSTVTTTSGGSSTSPIFPPTPPPTT